MTKNVYLLLPLFKQFMSASEKGRRSKYPGRKLAKGTLVQYNCIYKILLDFEQMFQPALQVTLLKNYAQTIIKKEKKYWNNFLKNFLHFLYQHKHYLDAYVSSVLKVLRTFFNYLLIDKMLPIGTFHKSFKIQNQLTTPLILQTHQLQRLIHDTAFENSLPLPLKRTKDIFIFGCTVGLRYCDLMRLQKKHLIQTGQRTYLSIHTQKTGTALNLPLPPYLLSIIEKYKRNKGNYLLPRLSSTNLNLQVKGLCAAAGWTYLLPKIRYCKGKPIALKGKGGASLRFCDQVTTHTMRRTAITTLLVLGVPELVVRRLSGHAPGSKEFYRYVVVAQDYLNQQVMDAYEKLGQKERYFAVK